MFSLFLLIAMSNSFSTALLLTHQLPSLTPKIWRGVVDAQDRDCLKWNVSEWQNVGADPDRARRLVQEADKLDRESIISRWERTGARIITLHDHEYPRQLREIHSAPPLLYVLGDVGALSTVSLAVVGTRQPTNYGLDMTRLLVEPVVTHGITIVSGLALGIDAAAHQIAVKHKTPTIAVLGCGIDLIYPWQHRELAEHIISAGGAIISEFPLGAEPERHHFPQRNRIISGLSKAVLLVEAGEKSGALITAKFAVEQNREILVVPGNISSPQSVGPLNWLKLGATPVTTAQDILNVFSMRQTQFQVSPTSIKLDDPIEQNIVETLRHGPRHIDELAEACRLDTSVLAAALSFLEIRDLIRHDGGMIYRLNA